MTYVQVVTLDMDRQDPFVQRHIRPCDKLWEALAPWRIDGQPRPVTERVIFTEAPEKYNTVARREALLAAALLGSSSKSNQVHDVMQRHKYILTLDYTMKMLHLEVRAFPC